MTRVLFNNHASLLIEADGKYLLTDPWYVSPAFGSWLPSFPSYLHPAYLSALKTNLTILISHAHDDHFDDDLLRIFDKETKFVTADFKSPSMKNRLDALGFENIQPVPIDGADVGGGFFVRSFVTEDVSHDDALYSIRTRDGVIVHANDNWRDMTPDNRRVLADECKPFDKRQVLYFSQANSASGYPLNYRCYTGEEKDRLLRKKVTGMVLGGMRNADFLGLDRIFSYAGFAGVYVKGRDYNDRALFTIAEFLNKLVAEHCPDGDREILSRVAVAPLYPGDEISLPSGDIRPAFVTGYADAAILEKSEAYYRHFGHADQCISYRNHDKRLNESKLDWFLTEFDGFARRRVAGPDAHYVDLMGKLFRIVIDRAGDPVVRTIKFGDGLTRTEDEANKTCYVDEGVMQGVLDGEILFEDLYTGYNAEWARVPKGTYNRDVVMMIAMFSYVYRNRLEKTYPGP